MEKKKSNIFILCASFACIVAVTFLAGLAQHIDALGLKIAALGCINLLNGLIALIAMKLTGMKIDIDFRNWRQYLIGAVIALSLSVVIAVIPALCGLSLIGARMDFSWFTIIYDFLFYMLIIGPVEEFIFRVYLQDVFVSIFDNCKWLGIIIAAFLFGLWHLINGSIIQAAFTFGIGLVFGFSKHKIKDCGYVGVAFGHGLYDFLNTIIRMFII